MGMDVSLLAQLMGQRAQFSGGKRALALGKMDCQANLDNLGAHGISINGIEDTRLGRLSAIWQHLGYGEYHEMSLEPGTEYRADITQQIAPEHRGIYDLVWDSGIVYSHDPVIGLQNATELLAENGVLVYSTWILQINRSQVLLEPNFLIDLLQLNGYEIKSTVVYSNSGGVIGTYDRSRVLRKIWSLNDIIPAHHACIYYAEQMLIALRPKIIGSFLRRAFRKSLRLLGLKNHSRLYMMVFAQLEERPDEFRTEIIKDVYRGHAIVSD